MTNPYQSPSSLESPNKRSRLARTTTLAVCCLALLTILFPAVSLRKGVNPGNGFWQLLFEIWGAVSPALFTGYATYKIFKRNAIARQVVMISSFGVSIVMIAYLSFGISLQPAGNRVGINMFGYVISDATKAQQFGVVLATVLILAIPGMLLATPSAKREFKDSDELTLS